SVWRAASSSSEVAALTRSRAARRAASTSVITVRLLVASSVGGGVPRAGSGATRPSARRAHAPSARPGATKSCGETEHRCWRLAPPVLRGAVLRGSAPPCRLETQDGGGHGHVQAVGATGVRDRHQRIQRDLGGETVRLAAEDERARFAELGALVVG